MDESEKRKERLQAMRMEASQAEACNDVENSTPTLGLANPLIETSSTPNVPVGSYATPRFDFYTDPMSPFTGDKSRSKVSNHIPPENLTPPRPAQPAHSNISPDQSMYQAQAPNYSPGLYRSPIGIARPFATHQRTPPPMWNWTSNPPIRSSSPRNFPSHGFVPRGSPGFPNSGQPRGHWVSNSPGPGPGPGPGPFSGPRGIPSPTSGGGGAPWSGSNMRPGPGLGHLGNPIPLPGGGMGPLPGGNMRPGPGVGHPGSPSPGSGRGGAQWPGNNMSPGSGRSGGRGSGSRDHVSSDRSPNSYYNKSMVEDPWKFLEPVIWSRRNIDSKNTPDLMNSWLPESIRAKKARVSEAANTSSSQPSLAEFLAASFNETVNKESVNDEQRA